MSVLKSNIEGDFLVLFSRHVGNKFSVIFSLLFLLVYLGGGAHCLGGDNIARHVIGSVRTLPFDRRFRVLVLDDCHRRHVSRRSLHYQIQITNKFFYN